MLERDCRRYHSNDVGLDNKFFQIYKRNPEFLGETLLYLTLFDYPLGNENFTERALSLLLLFLKRFLQLRFGNQIFRKQDFTESQVRHMLLAGQSTLEFTGVDDFLIDKIIPD